MERIDCQRMNYSLYREGESLFLSVICGSVGIFERTIELNSSEVTAMENDSEFLLNLATEIRNGSSSFTGRNISDFHLRLK